MGPCVSQGSPERQDISSELSEMNVFGELAHMITEAEKFHDGLSASWRTREVSTVAQAMSKDLRNREAAGGTSHFLCQG